MPTDDTDHDLRQGDKYPLEEGIPAQIGPPQPVGRHDHSRRVTAYIFYPDNEGELEDEETEILIRLLWRYVMHYDWTDDSIAALAEDIRQSHSHTPDDLEQMCTELEVRFAPFRGA